MEVFTFWRPHSCKIQAMDYYEGIVVSYLRADRALFVNTQCLIQLNEGNNPDIMGHHWYCDALTVDFHNKTIFLCETSFSASLTSLTKRLGDWAVNWKRIGTALTRDNALPVDWPYRPWLFVPEHLVPKLTDKLLKIKQTTGVDLKAKITTLEMAQPWRYCSWNRCSESNWPSSVPDEMRV
jgi:hypothetical protein